MRSVGVRVGVVRCDVRCGPSRPRPSLSPALARGRLWRLRSAQLHHEQAPVDLCVERYPPEGRARSRAAQRQPRTPSCSSTGALLSNSACCLFASPGHGCEHECRAYRRHTAQAPVPEAVRASVLCAAFSFRQGGWGWQGGCSPKKKLRPAAAF